MPERGCGGCRGLGAHRPTCHTQPGAMWLRLANAADSLGDQIGPSDMQASATVWGLAARFRRRYETERREKKDHA